MATQQQSMVQQQPQQPTTLDFFGTIQGFESGQRIAKLFASSQLVPDTFKGDIGGCLIALEMAKRMNANVLQLMQSLYIVNGKPSLTSAFLIASFNHTGKYTPIRYEFDGEEGTDSWGCRACTIEKATGEEIKSAKVTIGMAKAEGWYSRRGTKWVTMPELMLQYRSAAFLIRTTAPEIALGFQTTEELRDVVDITNQSQVIGNPSLDDVAMQAIESDLQNEETSEENVQGQNENIEQVEAKPTSLFE